jgi:hypothetical protein
MVEHPPPPPRLARIFYGVAALVLVLVVVMVVVLSPQPQAPPLPDIEDLDPSLPPMLYDNAPAPEVLIGFRETWQAVAVAWPPAAGGVLDIPQQAARTGRAPLVIRGTGAGADVQATTLPGLAAGQAYVFSHDFTVPQPEAIESLLVEMRFVGGVAIYLNGQELVRHRLDAADNYDPKAIEREIPSFVREGHKGLAQRAFPGLDPSALRAGTNTLSVVVRPKTGGAAGGAGDRLLMDVRLDAFRFPGGFVKGPYLQHVTDSQAVIMFETAALTTAKVEFGVAGGGLDRVASEPTPAASRHEILLTDLEPGQRYFYRVRVAKALTRDAGASDGTEPMLASKVYHFTTALRAGDPSPFVFLAYGDNRSQPKIHSAMIQLMLKDDPAFILNTGDITEIGVDYRQWQTQFFDPARPLMHYAPIWPSLGNHDGNHISYFEHFSLPDGESWYSFRYGDLEAFALNTAYSLAPGSEQLVWFEGALAASTAKWKVAFFHHPPFSCTAGRLPGFAPARNQLVPLFEKHGVQLVFSGHDHLYARGEKAGITYVITGGGGAWTYPTQVEPPNVLCERVYHYCWIRVDGDNLQVRAIDIDGREVDAFTLSLRP